MTGKIQASRARWDTKQALICRMPKHKFQKNIRHTRRAATYVSDLSPDNHVTAADRHSYEPMRLTCDIQLDLYYMIRIAVCQQNNYIFGIFLLKKSSLSEKSAKPTQLISHFPLERFIVIYPRLNLYNAIFILAVSDVNALYAGVDNHSLAK